MIKLLFTFVLFLSWNVLAQDIVFKDTNFQKAVLAYQPPIDLNGDGLIQRAESDSVKVLNLMQMNIQSIEDAYYFPNLEELVLTRNGIKELRISGFVKMKRLTCALNNLKIVEISEMPSLEHLGLNFNDELDTIVLERLPKLTTLSAQEANLKVLNVSDFPLLKYLIVSDNHLTTLDLTKNPEIIQVMLTKNLITELDIRNNPKLKTQILYLDKSVRIIGTDQQLEEIKNNGLGVSFGVGKN